MIKHTKSFMAAVYIAAIFSCNTNTVGNKPEVKAMASSMVDIECRAVALREQRFALANQIRFTQDTLIQTQDDTTELHNKLQSLNEQKQIILQQSIVLGDSIKHKLDSLLQNHLTDTAMKREFNEALNAGLETKNCIGKN